MKNNTFPAALKKHRVRLGCSLATMADLFARDHSTVARWETGNPKLGKFFEKAILDELAALKPGDLEAKKVTRRKLTKKEARRIAGIRWGEAVRKIAAIRCAKIVELE